MLDINEVTVSRRSKFLHRSSSLSLHQFVFVIIIAIAANDGVIGAPAQGTGCEAFRTCKQCTAGTTTTPCLWSFPDQKCLAGGQSSTTAEVVEVAATKAADCPVFRSVGGSENVTTTIASAGGPAPPYGFARFLANSSRITCHVNDDDYVGLADDDGATIRCVRTTEDDAPTAADDGDDAPAPGFCVWPTAIAYLAIAVDDGPPLVFDDPRDHYVSLYPASCDHTCPRDASASCTACQWDDGRYRYYCTWCAARGECGPYHACDRRRIADPRRPDDDGVESLPLSDRCARLVGPFSPVDGPWTGGTVLRVRVPDSGTLLWNPAGHDVTVTVAGRECEGPRWSGDTVVCTVAPAPQPYVGDAGCEPAAAGPVVLTIGGSPELTVRSTADFRFVDDPEQRPGTAAVPERWPSSTADPVLSSPPTQPPPGSASDSDQSVSDAFRTRGVGLSCLLGVVSLTCLYRPVRL